MASKNVVVIRTYDLTKRYKTLTAVDNLNIEVYRGEVFGFLGPNGAGKTTTISMLLGLIRPTVGSAEVLGYNMRTQASPALRQVGALVEAAFYPYLSARENLWVMAQVGSVSVTRGRIDDVLEQVGLAARAKDKFQTFSTGMKQRLGLGAALIHDPDVLILDEPTNGLDPAGMMDIRQLIRHLARDQGKTIFLSSHLLHEVEQVCDRVLILDRGRTIAVGRVKELLQQGGHIEIHIAQPERAEAVLRGLDWVEGVLLRGGVLYVDAPSERAADLTAALAAEGLYLHGLKIAERSLESFFLAVTGNREVGGSDV
ncbi:MAG: ABC transporter ATP-binding protein [Anaerolineae bacterium]|nr:MAG: ABC transporter ATP-binding protein [Anaerolineae bacterium]